MVRGALLCFCGGGGEICGGQLRDETAQRKVREKFVRTGPLEDSGKS